MGLCLGCHHEPFERVYYGHKVKGVRYNMESSLLQAVEHYKTLCAKHGYKPNLRQVDTPFIDTTTIDPDVENDGPGGGVLATASGGLTHPICTCALTPTPSGGSSGSSGFPSPRLGT